jgi:hypothetical protein
MNKENYLNNIESLSAEQLVEGITSGIVTFEELRKTEKFDFSKQKEFKRLLKHKDDEAFSSAKSITELEHYLVLFPDGYHSATAQSEIIKKQEELETELRLREERERNFQEIKENINDFTPSEIIQKLSRDDLRELCDSLGINPDLVYKYKEPDLKFNDIPEHESEIPTDYTDIFFWGIPSSGKTCALAAVLSTINKNYSMEAPDSAKKFGATYRDSLVNMFKNEFGNLPGRTNEDRTQYMPFQLYKRGEKKKRKHKVSFFELSGEVFRYFYEHTNNSQVVSDDQRENIKNSFQTLNLLLKSNNKKIHYFFIDYAKETKTQSESTALTQSNYLDAAATYFRDNDNIFKKKTDAVFVIITKSDNIHGENKEKIAKQFLEDNFGSFMEVLKSQCKANSVRFKVKLFSIGKVYFKRICKINRSYSEDIIKDIFSLVKPASNSTLKKFFNS